LEKTNKHTQRNVINVYLFQKTKKSLGYSDHEMNTKEPQKAAALKYDQVEQSILYLTEVGKGNNPTQKPMTMSLDT